MCNVYWGIGCLRTLHCGNILGAGMQLHYGNNAGLSPEASIESGLAAGLGLALVQPRVPQHPSTLEEVVDTET